MNPLRIDFVSPLPPVRSGIADYAVELLPGLAGRAEVAEVRVVRLAGQPVDEGVAARWRPVEAGETGRGGRLPLYQMGNNRHHEGVLELALERPGVVTLHDLVLHHLLVERTLSRGVFEPYVESLERDHGWVGRAVATTRRWGGYSEAGLFALPASRDLLRRQRGVLVHSRWAAGVLAEEDPDIAVRAVPMGIPLPPEAGPPAFAGGEAAAVARAALGLPAGRPVVGSFGFQTPIKRTVAAVRALARPELAGVWLLVVGEVSPEVDLEGEARRAGVADRVRVTGFVDAATFARALAACDLALNLRYPTAGETSASLLRLLAAGRGAVVSDYAQFAELPAGAAVRVALGEGESEALAAAVSELLADPARLAAMGEAARRHVAREHAPERAAAAVAGACVELAGLAPPGPRPAAAPPPSSLAWPRLAGEIAPSVAGPPGARSAPAERRVGEAIPRGWAAAAASATSGERRIDVGGAPSVAAGRARRAPGAQRTGGGRRPPGAAAEARAWPPGERRTLRLEVTNRGPGRWLAARRGPGGVAFEATLSTAAGDPDPHRPWVPLPCDVEPGGAVALELELRRPPGPARLRVEPLVLDGWAGDRVTRPGSPLWEGDLDEIAPPTPAAPSAPAPAGGAAG